MRGRGALTPMVAVFALAISGCGSPQEDAVGPHDGDESAAAAHFERIIMIVVDTLLVDHLGVYG